MGEAIFAKYSKGGGGNFVIPPELTISNSTKIGLGLDRDATLDDCLKLIGKASNAISNDYATLIVTLKDADGNTLPNHNITMKPITGTNLTYRTDGIGQCIFKTNAGQVTLYDNSNNGYYDINVANTQTIDCPVGTIKEIEMTRWKKLANGSSLGTFTSNQNFKFSPYAGTVDVTVRGQDGQGGYSSTIFNNANRSTVDWGFGYTTIMTVTFNYKFSKYNYYCTGGIGSSQPCCIYNFQQGTKSMSATITNSNFNNLFIHYNGCNGKAGSTKSGRVTITNTNQSITISKNASTDCKWNISNISSKSNVSEYWMRYATSNLLFIKFNSTPIRSRGKTGGSVTGFGYSASGGSGGYSIPYMNQQPDTTYNSEISITGGGQGGTSSILSMNLNDTISRYSGTDSDGDSTNYYDYTVYLNGNIVHSPGSTGSSGHVSITNFHYCK